jgi:hypothetical protein
MGSWGTRREALTSNLNRPSVFVDLEHLPGRPSAADRQGTAEVTWEQECGRSARSIWFMSLPAISTI